MGKAVLRFVELIVRMLAKILDLGGMQCLYCNYPARSMNNGNRSFSQLPRC